MLPFFNDAAVVDEDIREFLRDSRKSYLKEQHSLVKQLKEYKVCNPNYDYSNSNVVRRLTARLATVEAFIEDIERIINIKLS